MAPKKVSIPFSMGRADRVDPKLAPFGVLATAQNLRVRKDGRLASRTGYQPLTMKDQANNTLVAYDLHEFSNGRLCALGASNGEGYPVDIYEHRGIPSATPWRSSDESGTARLTLTPFTTPRQVCGVPQPAAGINQVDCAAGGGYVATIYKPQGGTVCHVQIVRESDDQVIYAAAPSQEWARARVAYGSGRFFFLGGNTASADIQLGSFIPGTSTSITTIATVDASAFSMSPATLLEINAVGNPTNSAVIVGYGATNGTTADIKRYNTSGTQQGSTISLSGLTGTLRAIDVEADEADNTVNILTTHNSGATRITELRTYNLSNSLLDGPTNGPAGFRGTMCRLPARTGFTTHVAIVAAATDDILVEYRQLSDHSLTSSVTVANASLTTAVIAASSENQTTGIVFGGCPENSGARTNALWYVSDTSAHMATRDLRNSGSTPKDSISSCGMSYDSSTGKLAWCSLYYSGEDVENFAITTLDLHSSERRQSCSAGGMLYLAGAPVQIYDGRIATEACFNEVPFILDTAAGSSGDLEPNATYTYICVWEYTLPDGTFYESPPSAPVEHTTGPAEDAVTVTIKGPHSSRVALGDATYGSEVTGVLYRTVWDAANASQGSQFHEVGRFTCPATLSDYGADITFNDELADDDAATMPVLYTQAGPVEHNAPEMASYISASSARIVVAGLARQNEFQESKEQELDEAINFSGLSSFIGRAPNPINGVMSLDGVRILFTRTDLFVVSGEGAQNDASGALPQPVELASPGGLKDWRSLLKGPDGVWFQLDDSKLYRMPRGTGAPEWLGIDVQDTLASYPTITGACRNRADDAIVFACENAAGTDARILARSLRTGIWTEDLPVLQSSQGIEALCSYGDQLAYISGGAVYAQHATSFTDGASSVIVTRWKTHPIYPFDLGGNGLIHELLVTGEYRSAGTLALRVSYDDGISFNNYSSFTLTGLSTGATIHRKWDILQSDVQNAVFELTFTPSTPGEGLIINMLTLLVDPSVGLKDVNPSEVV